MITRIVNLPPLPDRPRSGHKGSFGRALIVGGSENMIGAPVLAGTAALRMGAGLVQIAMPRDVLAAALSVTPELIGLGLGRAEDEKLLIAAADEAGVVVIGLGMGQQPAGGRRLMKLIASDRAMVIDADGLNILAAGKAWPKKFTARAVLTPHPGEMKRLMKFLGGGDVPIDDAARIELAARAAKKFDQAVVLKGDRTVVADSGGGKVYLNRTGDSSLSKAGTGDVLSGIIATLLAQKMDRFEAACAGVNIHGRAGEIAGKKFGRRSVLARDVIDALPSAIGEYVAIAGTRPTRFSRE